MAVVISAGSTFILQDKFWGRVCSACFLSAYTTRRVYTQFLNVFRGTHFFLLSSNLARTEWLVFGRRDLGCWCHSRPVSTSSSSSSCYCVIIREDRFWWFSRACHFSSTFPSPGLLRFLNLGCEGKRPRYTIYDDYGRSKDSENTVVSIACSNQSNNLALLIWSWLSCASWTLVVIKRIMIRTSGPMLCTHDWWHIMSSLRDSANSPPCLISKHSLTDLA